MIELTPSQQEALQAGSQTTLRLIDPRTKNTYVLLPESLYDQIVAAISPNGEQAQADDGFQIPAGVRSSQEAFWRDLPSLLTSTRLAGQWALYYGGTQVGIGDYTALIRESLRRRIPDDQCYLGRIEPRELPPWETEEVEPIGLHYLDD